MLAAALIAAMASASGNDDHAQVPALTVCADPNNLPFSNRAGEGFENEVAALLARQLGRHLEYVWWAQRRGFARNTLGAESCDLWPGVAQGMEGMATTRPYYASTYVFVTRADRDLGGLTLDDPRLRSLTLGVQLVGDDGMNTPPVHALGRRGIVGHLRGYMLYGDYAQPHPPAAIIEAVASGEVDVALAWGPLAGYFAARSPRPLRVEAIRPDDDAALPMHFAISVGIAPKASISVDQVDHLLEQDRPQLHAILDRYRVPRVEVPPG